MVLAKRINKAFVIFFLLVIGSTSFSQGSWHSVDLPISNNLNSLFFTDSLTGWSVGDSGVIIYTNDGGISWEIQQSNTTNDIVNVFFLNNNIGWASSHNYSVSPYGTVLLRTIDGGQNWITNNYEEENIFISTIFYLDSMRGWMGGTPHALVSTIDGGITWNNAVIDTSTLAFFPVLNINFYNEQYGYASGGIFDIAGVIWRTNNGGERWYAINTDDAPADEIHGLYTFDSINVIGSGGDPDFGYGVGMIRTLDGGDSWNYDEIGVQGIAYDIDFVSSFEGWAPLGPEAKFVYSVDTGQSWNTIDTPENLSIFDITFPDSKHGYAVGMNGAFLSFTPQPPVNTEDNYLESKTIELGQNYPNPFSNYTTIDIWNCNLEKPSFVVVYNWLGEEVDKLLVQRKTESTAQVNLNVGELKNGIYTYRFVSESFVSKAKHLVLIR